MSGEIVFAIADREVVVRLIRAYAIVRSFYEDLYGGPVAAARQCRDYCVIRDTIRRLETQWYNLTGSVWHG